MLILYVNRTYITAGHITLTKNVQTVSGSNALYPSGVLSARQRKDECLI